MNDRTVAVDSLGTTIKGFAVIPGYDNLYLINRDGIVVSPGYTDRNGFLRKPRILKPSKRGKGYLCVGLMKNGVQRHVSLHRLVARAFIPNPEMKPQVNHIDGNKENNCAGNLEWVTNQENVIHAFETGLKKSTPKNGEKNSMAKLKENDVLEIINSNESAKELSLKYKISISCIYKMKERKRWKHI